MERSTFLLSTSTFITRALLGSVLVSLYSTFIVDTLRITENNVRGNSMYIAFNLPQTYKLYAMMRLELWKTEDFL